MPNFILAKRSSVVEVDEPWGNVVIERSMPSLKFYHDLTFGNVILFSVLFTIYLKKFV